MGDWSAFGKLLLAIGGGIMILGLFLLGLGKLFNIGRLPGDIYYQKGNFTFYFPLATSIILSILLTVVLNLLSRK
ncbi:MAG: DUF2905 domain-containing protein [Firmicutes bacterium]|nr:DUF2905 domain-containing protein [Bacillota bacterium]